MRLSLRRYIDLLVSYLQPQWGKALAMVVLLFAGVGLQLLNPQILRYFIDTAISGGAEAVLIYAALLFIGVALLNQAILKPSSKGIKT